MKVFNIQQATTVKQDAKEGIFTVDRTSFKRLIHAIVSEHGTYNHGSLHVCAHALPMCEKKLILSYLLDLEDYVRLTESNTFFEIMFEEHYSHIQSLLDQECDEVYHDAMYEMGMVKHTFHDNGEIYYTRR